MAVVGATGAVGREMLRVLERRNFPLSELTLLASSRSAGRELEFRGEKLPVRELKEDVFEGIDIALFSAGGSVSRRFVPIAAKSGCVAIDNSSAFRMDPDTPLVVPEINAEAVRRHRGVIANPNCTTAITLMALHPLHKAFHVTRLIAATYQAVSGAGAKAIEELRGQVEALAANKPISCEVFPYQIAFNAIPHVDSFQPNGYTREEMKLENEARKIMSHPELRASATCVRVPVYRAHSVAVAAEFREPVSVEAARQALEAAPGLDVLDEPEKLVYPTPLHVAEKDNCAVGRLRKDIAFDNGLSFWVAGDQLLKGAALNAVQIAEELLKSA